MANIRKRVGFRIQCPEGQQIEVVKPVFEKEKRRLLKKGVRVLNWKIKAGYDGDDFIHNQLTFLFTGVGYKIPRIIKNMLIK